MSSNVKSTTCFPAAMSISIAGVLASLWFATSAFASDPFPSETVNFTDLNVNTSAGIEVLYGRIHAAAGRVCAPEDTAPLHRVDAAICTRKAEAQAIQTLALPQLTAYYQIKRGKHVEPLSASR